MNGRPDARLTPEWMPGEYHDPQVLLLPIERAEPDPRTGPWSRWTQPDEPAVKE